MTTVFIGGSRKITRLPTMVTNRLDSIVRKQIPVLIGDANGADKAVQTYLKSANYDRVTVYCTGDVCRNNVGGWPVTNVRPNTSSQRKDRKFFTLKDRAMSSVATHGLMLWDAESLGTLVNIIRLHREKRIAVVYLQPTASFIDIKTDKDLATLATCGTSALFAEAEQAVASEFSDRVELPVATTLPLF